MDKHLYRYTKILPPLLLLFSRSTFIFCSLTTFVEKFQLLSAFGANVQHNNKLALRPRLSSRPTSSTAIYFIMAHSCSTQSKYSKTRSDQPSFRVLSMRHGQTAFKPATSPPIMPIILLIGRRQPRLKFEAICKAKSSPGHRSFCWPSPSLKLGMNVLARAQMGTFLSSAPLLRCSPKIPKQQAVLFGCVGSIPLLWPFERSIPYPLQ